MNKILNFSMMTMLTLSLQDGSMVLFGECASENVTVAQSDIGCSSAGRYGRKVNA